MLQQRVGPEHFARLSIPKDTTRTPVMILFDWAFKSPCRKVGNSVCHRHIAISCDAFPITMPEFGKSLESIPFPAGICGFSWDFTRHYSEFERYY